VRFLTFRVRNYKSFLSSPILQFSNNLNVIVGRNNVGKTALLEAISLRFENNPHRSLSTVPTRATAIKEVSSVRFSLEIGQDELPQLLREYASQFYLPAASTRGAVDESNRLIEWFQGSRQARGTHGSVPLEAEFIDQPFPETSPMSLLFEIDSDGQIKLSDSTYKPGVTESRLARVLLSVFRERIYFFRAERMNIGEHIIGVRTVLESNAANLAEVLFNLAANPSRFRRFEAYARAVFPEIKQITVPFTGSVCRILLWTIEPDEEREDLAIPLAASGTGVSQILALLYVIVTAEHPRVVVIDEPHSFLHPGAVRKLLEILSMHPKHQYIMSTHSPVAITAAATTTILLVRMNGPESVVEQLDGTAPDDLKGVLAEVGARLSDVYGADNILWVEGRTEEECFPLVRALVRTQNEPITGTAILGVRQTGDFERRDAERVISIYERLSRAGALLPPAVGFLFDREGRSAAQQADLERRLGGRVFFLPRRMFENYLLKPAGIAGVMNMLAANVTDEVAVAAWLQEHSWDEKYFSERVAVRTPAFWHEKVHGARLLSDIFSGLSKSRLSYRKVEHGVYLTKWLVVNDSSDLLELARFIAEIIHGGRTPASGQP